jgi:beta-hydroxylase
MELRRWIRKPRRQLVRVLKRRGRPAVNGFLARYSEVGDPAVFDPADFPWAATLEGRWRDIRAEAERVLALRDVVPAFQDVSPDQYRISPDDQWKTFWLRGFGHRSKICCDFCPLTAGLVDGVPGVENAFFSILAPGKHVIPHRGVFKGIINYHLGLIVPEKQDCCRMRVGDRFFHWEEGESRIFDDTREHEVWNDTDQHRVVLMLQFRRPLRSPGRQVRDLFIEVLKRIPYVAVAVRNQKRFEERFAAALEVSATGPAVGPR